MIETDQIRRDRRNGCGKWLPATAGMNMERALASSEGFDRMSFGIAASALYSRAGRPAPITALSNISPKCFVQV